MSGTWYSSNKCRWPLILKLFYLIIITNMIDLTAPLLGRLAKKRYSIFVYSFISVILISFILKIFFFFLVARISCNLTSIPIIYHTFIFTLFFFF